MQVTSLLCVLRPGVSAVSFTKRINIKPRYTSICSCLLLMSGDVELNPGLRPPKYPCSICSKAVKNSDPAVSCDQCVLWVHNACSGLSNHMYECMQQSSTVWICPACGMPSFTSSFFRDTSSISTCNSFTSLDNNTGISFSTSTPHGQAKRKPQHHSGLKMISGECKQSPRENHPDGRIAAQ